MVHDRLVGRVKSKGSDLHGRWSFTCLYRGNLNPICIINAYMPCCQSNPGMTTYTQQLYQRLEVSNVNQVREKCWEDLAEFIDNKRNEGQAIILGMDANANPNDEGGNPNTL